MKKVNRTAKTDYSGIIEEGLLPLVIPIDLVKPDPRNARSHPARNIETIKTSLKTYRQRKPIIVRKDTMTIEAGNGMLEAAKSLGWPVIAAILVNDDEDYAKGFGIMDNQSALLAEWDFPILKDLLLELDTGAFDMELTGFELGEIEGMMTQFNIPEDNKAIDEDAMKDTKNECPKCGFKW